MPPHFIFEMNRVSKKFGAQTVLSNISLSFYYGAKIGIVGENGAGKSTLLKIMAGIDTDIEGETKLTKGMSVKYVAQEPEFDLDATVRENLLTAVKPVQDKIDAYNEVAAAMGDPEQADNFDVLMEKMGKDVTGTVDKVMIENGKPKLYVGSNIVDLTAISSVVNTPAAAQTES
ncbi:hypothetical protein FACS189427_13320 [Planctomycetales bacterium]|nr:hypothetical protein FACS189427_13320 [Planctomycetales bacterium]